MLSDLGCESVTAAANSEQAIAAIESQRFDVAILDMNLGGEKSHPVADALAARGVPFMFATGYDGHDMRVGYRERPLLKKPIEARELVRLLSGLLISNDGL